MCPKRLYFSFSKNDWDDEFQTHLRCCNKHIIVKGVFELYFLNMVRQWFLFNIFVSGRPQTLYRHAQCITLKSPRIPFGSSSSSPRNFITHIGITVLLLWCRLRLPNTTTKTSFDSQISKNSITFRLPVNYDRCRDYNRFTIVILSLRLVKSHKKSDSQISKSVIRTPKNTSNYVRSTWDKICLVGSYDHLTCMEVLLSITYINRKN